MKTAQQKVYNLSFLLGDDSLMESSFCKKSPSQLFINFSCLLELTDLLPTLTEEADRKKKSASNTSKCRVRSDKTEVSPLAVETGSLFHEWNVRQLEERQLSTLLYCLYFSLCVPIPSSIKWYISMHSSKPLSIVFIPTIPAKDRKKSPVSHYLPNFST